MRLAARRRRAAALTLGCAVLSLTGPEVAAAQSEGLPAEALVAVIGAETPSAETDEVLLSDVVLRARLELAAAGETVTDARLDRALLSATLAEIVGEVLVAREAARLRQESPSENAIEAQRLRLVLSVGGEVPMRRLLDEAGASEGELRAIASRRATVEAFFRANLEGNTSISDATVLAAYEGGEHPFADRPIEEIREPLRAWLAMSALRRDVARWLTVLRDRSVVRVAILDDVAAHPAADEAP